MTASDMPTARTVEKVLRAAGLSRRAAKQIIHDGFARLHEHLDDETRRKLLAMSKPDPEDEQ